MSESFHTRGGFKTPGSFRPVSPARIARPIITSNFTTENKPTKQQLREELAQAARNTAGALRLRSKLRPYAGAARARA